MHISHSTFRSFFCYLFLLSILIVPGTLVAEVHEIEMRNTDPGNNSKTNLFTPAVLKIAAGDIVRFKAIDAGHNSASKKGMLPEGAVPWNGGIDEEIEIQFTIEGTYGYLCVPHYEMGMVGLILVGDYKQNVNTARTVRHSGKSKRAFRALFNAVDKL